MEDRREELINELCLYVQKAVEGRTDIHDTKNMLYMLLNKYEITSRCTEVAQIGEERNEFLLKHFIMAKTVKGCTRKTLRAYADGLKRILWTIGKTADDITADDIRFYLAVRQNRDKISKTTADNELRLLRTFYCYLASEEFVAGNPTVKLDRIKCEHRRKEAFTEIEIERLRMKIKDAREQAVVELLLSTGCRVTELCQIMLKEIDGNRILIHGKGEKDRFVYMNAKAIVAVEKYIKERQDRNPYLFPGGIFGEISRKGCAEDGMESWWKSPEKVTAGTHISTGTIENMMRRIAIRAGVEKANPHKFRRTCATMALRRGMPIAQVSRMLGHESIATTQIYLDLDERELEQAHNKYVI